jgi:hypothetical protein
LIEQLKIFLREVADTAPVRIANHNRHQHRIYADRNLEIASLSRRLICLLRTRRSDNAEAKHCATD